MSERVRTSFRLVAVLLVAAAALLTYFAYLDARRKGNWNYEANLWISLFTAAVGALGWFFPRAVGWATLPFTTLWFLWALAYAGFSLAALVIGGAPLAVSLLFVLSGRTRRPGATTEASPEHLH